MPGGDAITLAELSGMGVDRLARVGPGKLAGLHAMGIDSLLDLLFHYPRRYVDRTRQARVAELIEGEQALVIGRVRKANGQRTRRGRTLVRVELHDGSAPLDLTFFNQPWRERQLDPGGAHGSQDVAVFGKVEIFRGRRRMTNPVVDLVGDRTGRIVPIYPQSEKARLSSWELGAWVLQVLDRCRARGLDDPVPGRVLDDLGLVARDQALRVIHAPESMRDLSSARDRLVFDELLRIQLSLVRTKRELERTAKGIAHCAGDEGVAPGLVDRFLEGLPYELTAAQGRAVAEIRSDLGSGVPMHRLLQGDVGAGKTVVAVAALLVAVQGGHQGVLMAPTEVLAEQHVAAVRSMLDGVSLSSEASLFGDRPVAVALFTNRTSAAERRRIQAGLQEGTVDVVVGTHALIHGSLDLRSLGVVVIDEQHRFGVEQRAALRRANDDGTVPDVLVMTATPIPRTAAMTVYGDLDVTVLDELPPGRQRIETVAAHSEAEISAAWKLVRDEVAEGNRAYVVCPLVEGSDRVEAAAAGDVYEDLASGELSGLRLGLLHGRLKAEEKQAVMEQFRHGSLDVLVATTVIEVGVDVPEATVMVVLDADRFGIAQLHQLRGRVGRGTRPSHCVLVARGDLGEDAVERVAAMVRTTDGFELAEVDLELRGEGTVMGERQKGRSDLRLASLRRDRRWVEVAREVAFDLVGEGDGLDASPRLVEELDVLLAPEDEEFLTKG